MRITDLKLRFNFKHLKLLQFLLHSKVLLFLTKSLTNPNIPEDKFIWYVCCLGRKQKKKKKINIFAGLQLSKTIKTVIWLPISSWVRMRKKQYYNIQRAFKMKEAISVVTPKIIELLKILQKPIIATASMWQWLCWRMVTLSNGDSLRLLNWPRKLLICCTRISDKEKGEALQHYARR